MRRGDGGRLPKPSLAPSSPAPDNSFIGNLDSAFSRRDSDAASLCSSRPASTAGTGVGAALDEEYASKARMAGEVSIAAVRAPEKEAEELEMEVNELISGPSRRQALEAEKEALTAEIQKFEGVLNASQAFVRALQDAEELAVVDRPMPLVGVSDWWAMEQDDAGDEDEDNGVHTQDAWEDGDPDEYSYEELIALGEVGMESKGLAADTIASLPLVTYKTQDGNVEQCVICCVEFNEGESLVVLPCKHPYHSECINQWLQLNKVCPMCKAEVST